MNPSDLSDPVNLVYCSHSRWPLPPEPTEVSDQTIGESIIDVSILDSSFNPPTLAHVALFQLPKPLSDLSTRFDAKLLLYSMKNADKTSKSGDATPSERIEMMILVAKEIINTSANPENENIAVAICQEPIFVEKSKVLHTYLLSRMASRSLSASSTTVRLTFLMGIDTLERLFMPRYYNTDDLMQMALEAFFTSSTDDSRILCAQRALGESYQHSDTGWINKAQRFIASGAITLTAIDVKRSTLSSSEVRKNIQLGQTTLWKHQVLNRIACYIEERGLYREQ